MAESMQHWNGQIICAIDVETTGTDPFWHEIVQLAILPLDSNLEPRKDVLPLDLYIKPEYPERWEPAAKDAISKNSLKKVLASGVDPEQAKDYLEAWIAKLGLPMSPSGIPKRIIPLGHNYGFDKGFIEGWLGSSLYSEYVDSRARDTMTVSLFMNERYAVHAEKVPYSKNTLAWLANKLGVETHDAHNALADCRITAEVYRQLTRKSMIWE